MPKLLPGESVIQQAPIATLPNGHRCVPQHYFEFEHTLRSVEAVLADVEFDPRYALFVSEEDKQLYLQVGIIGPDNYSPQDEQKIVYGRKWRIERGLPTSEVIQTCYLALQKAREHEIRERLVLSLNGRKTTPFNNHHDLPLMAMHAEFLENDDYDQLSIEGALRLVRYDEAEFQVMSKQHLGSGAHFVQLRALPSKLSLLEEIQNGLVINLVLENESVNHFLSRLMEHLVLSSNRLISENFKFKGFARFSENVSVCAIAHLSAATRALATSENSRSAHERIQYHVDENRVPLIAPSLYSERLKHQLAQFEPLQGFKPAFV
jgi:hypothetical protein